ncbi:ATP-grasp domain-containing protein [Dactylosporangium sp. CA-152071]|uniref:ATP-grasp domain-containing protein n=1 Tax=Dactylosporangium sp. CA-152071 TaxID=3239933 RepID=UPI003D9376C5
MSADDRRRVLLIDRIGYSHYRRHDGSPFMPADRFAVTVLTDRAKVGEVSGAEIDAVIGIDLDDVPLMLKAGEMVHRHRPLDLVVAISERLLLPAARLRDRLGIPGQSEERTLLVRNKLRMKEHLGGLGVRVPRHEPFSPEAVATLLERHGRVVLKPTEGMASTGVFVLDRIEQLRPVLDANPGLDRANYEVEEFIDGNLHHVDSVVRDGEPVVATVSRTVDPTTSYHDAAPCRDHNIGPGPDREALLAFNAAVLKCFPWFSGVTHHEMFLDRAGEVVFCEIAGRPGGGGIIPGFRHQTGVDLDEAAVMAQLGDPLPVPAKDPVTDPMPLIGYVMVYQPGGVLEATPAAPDVPWLVDLAYLRRPGDVLPVPTRWSDAVAAVTVEGATESEVLDRLDHMVRHVRGTG